VKGMGENPPGEKLTCTSVFRSLLQTTSSNIAGIATNACPQMFGMVSIMMAACCCYPTDFINFTIKMGVEKLN